MTRHEKNLLRRYEKFVRCNEYWHDQTKQREFERSFESRDMEESEAAIKGANAANEVLASVGRRDISLRSPADIVMFRLDLEFWEEVLRRDRDKRLLHVFRAMMYGLTCEEFGVPETTFRRLRKKVENILAEER
jgi:hypothetical protein